MAQDDRRAAPIILVQVPFAKRIRAKPSENYRFSDPQQAENRRNWAELNLRRGKGAERVGFEPTGW